MIGVLFLSACAPVTAPLGPTSPSSPAPVNLVFTPTAPLLEARAEHTATLLPSGQVLVVGGRGATGNMLTSAELFDPLSRSFTATGAMRVRRRGATATLLHNGLVLVVGGSTEFDGFSTASAELYDWRTGAFHDAGNMTRPRSLHTATLLADGRVFIAGGMDSQDRRSPAFILATTEIYDPATNSFSPGAPMAETRSTHAAIRLDNGHVLMTGGDTFSPRGSVESYDPGTNSISILPGMNSPRTRHHATRLANGTFLFCGGTQNDPATVFFASCEMYDPGEARFVPFVTLLAGRSAHTVTFMQDGRLLIAAGENHVGAGPAVEPIASLEIVDPMTRVSTALADLTVKRRNHTATLLPDGRVLIAGGQNNESGPLASAELN